MVRRRNRVGKWGKRYAPGPSTVAGKLEASRNAVKHGLSGTPEFTSSEKTRLGLIRHAFCDLMDNSNSFEADIHECAVAQVLIERTITLRHQAHFSGSPTVRQLERLVRFESQLVNRRNKLLAALDVNEYAHTDSLISQEEF